MQTHTATLIEDGENLVLPLPLEMLQELGWEPGDTLIWTDNEDGTFSLRKRD